MPCHATIRHAGPNQTSTRQACALLGHHSVYRQGMTDERGEGACKYCTYSGEPGNPHDEGCPFRKKEE